MTTVRLKFIKGNEVKYISHLDLMRTFQRAIRRAGIPVAYSSGFNPHQELSFGAPLSLGTTSRAEYVDIKLSGRMAVGEITDRFNKTLPEGIKILDGVILPENFKSAMSLVSHARYVVRIDADGMDTEELRRSIQSFLSAESIKVMKEQPKKGFETKEIDIRPMILEMNAAGGNGSTHFIECLLLSGSRANLNPELLMKAFGEFLGQDIKGIRINREAVYAEKDGRLVDLLDYVR